MFWIYLNMIGIYRCCGWFYFKKRIKRGIKSEVLIDIRRMNVYNG